MSVIKDSKQSFLQESDESDALADSHLADVNWHFFGLDSISIEVDDWLW